MPEPPAQMNFLLSPTSSCSKIKAVRCRLMKIEIIPTWLCRGLEAVIIVVVVILFKTSCFPFMLLLLLLACCRQSGCRVLLFSPARWLAPTRTPSLTQGCGTESRNGWEVTVRRGPGSGWCSESRWAPASGRSSPEGCWLLLLPSPPVGVGGMEVERQCQFLLQSEAG